MTTNGIIAILIVATGSYSVIKSTDLLVKGMTFEAIWSAFLGLALYGFGVIFR